MTVDARRIAGYDADVVEHRRRLDELTVELKLGMPVTNGQCPDGYLAAMLQQETFQGIVCDIKMVDYIQRIEH